MFLLLNLNLFLVTAPTRSAQATARLFPGVNNVVRLDPLDPTRFLASLDAGVKSFNDIRSVESNLIRDLVTLPIFSPAGQHLQFFTVEDEGREMDRRATIIALVARSIARDFQLTPQQAAFGLRNLLVSDTKLRDLCPQNPRCTPNSKYRTADGSCNNLANPTWGMSNTPTQRILPPTYDDGIHGARSRSVDGSPLPNVRQISSNVFLDINRPDQFYTTILMQWGQFLDHDFAHVPFPTMENGTGIQCCPNGTMAPNLHPRCLPIDTTGDAFYGPRGSRCMNFVRSMLAVGPGPGCNFGFSEQVGGVTDGSGGWTDVTSRYSLNSGVCVVLRQQLPPL